RHGDREGAAFGTICCPVEKVPILGKSSARCKSRAGERPDKGTAPQQDQVTGYGPDIFVNRKCSCSREVLNSRCCPVLWPGKWLNGHHLRGPVLGCGINGGN